MKHKRKVRRAVQAAGLPEDILLGMPRILLRGDSMLFLENHQGVIEYAPERMRINTALGVLTVDGEALELSELGENDLMLKGTLHSVTFTEGGAHGKARMV